MARWRLILSTPQSQPPRLGQYCVNSSPRSRAAWKVLGFREIKRKAAGWRAFWIEAESVSKAEALASADPFYVERVPRR